MSTVALNQPTVKTSRWQTFFRILLGINLILTGVGHLTTQRIEFQAQVPTWLPLDADFVVIASGIVELVLAAALIFARGKYRIITGWVVAAFFVAVFPGNISQYVNRIDGLGMYSDQARLTRLFFQPVLVAWALWSTGAWQAWRNRSKPND